jgi:hypothetical protein
MFHTPPLIDVSPLPHQLASKRTPETKHHAANAQWLLGERLFRDAGDEYNSMGEARYLNSHFTDETQHFWGGGVTATGRVIGGVTGGVAGGVTGGVTGEAGKEGKDRGRGSSGAGGKLQLGGYGKGGSSTNAVTEFHSRLVAESSSSNDAQESDKKHRQSATAPFASSRRHQFLEATYLAEAVDADRSVVWGLWLGDQGQKDAEKERAKREREEHVAEGNGGSGASGQGDGKGIAGSGESSAESPTEKYGSGPKKDWENAITVPLSSWPDVSVWLRSGLVKGTTFRRILQE